MNSTCCILTIALCARLTSAQADKLNELRTWHSDDGRLILELAFERNPAVLIPQSKGGETEKYLFVTRAPEGGARFLVRSIDEHGWGEPELMNLGSLTRNWVTAFDQKAGDEKVWELPMIELHLDPSL
ncbi:MAG: hypothetical protein ACI9ZV_000703 [Candidatus Azotimanducaceae bacterium]